MDWYVSVMLNRAHLANFVSLLWSISDDDPDIDALDPIKRHVTKTTRERDHFELCLFKQISPCPSRTGSSWPTKLLQSTRHPRGTLPSSQAEQGRIAPGIRVLKQQEAAPSIIMSADMSMHCHKHVMKLK